MGFNDRTSTLKLFDTRTSEYVLSIANQPDPDTSSATSKYSHASLHPNGYIVSMPDMRKPVNEQSNFREYRSTIYVISGRKRNRPKYFNITVLFDFILENRVISAQFYEGTVKNSIVSVSSDKSVIFSDYMIN